jgi:hypothetical protein
MSINIPTVFSSELLFFSERTLVVLSCLLLSELLSKLPSASSWTSPKDEVKHGESNREDQDPTYSSCLGKADSNPVYTYSISCPLALIKSQDFLKCYALRAILFSLPFGSSEETLPDHHPTSLLVCLDIHSRRGPREVNLSKCTRFTVTRLMPWLE